jgi:S-adenosylmethionine/arginine decarboxylase-like enzyme
MLIQHKHLIVRAEVESPPQEHETRFMKDWFVELIAALKMKIMDGPHVNYCHMEGNRGFTGVCIIETSHVAIHIWDEVSPALIQLDVYTCGAMDTDMVFKFLDPFDPVKIEYKYLDRENGLILLDNDIIEKFEKEKVA